MIIPPSNDGWREAYTRGARRGSQDAADARPLIGEACLVIG